jgi:hypothetical protein
MSQRWVQVEHFAKCPHCGAKNNGQLATKHHPDHSGKNF